MPNLFASTRSAMELVDTTNNGRPGGREDELIALQIRKLAQQKELANEFNDILTREGGLNEHTRQTCKNLEYAIAIATRPGAIDYYRAPEEIERIVKNGDLVALTSRIARVQQDIDQVKKDIQQAADLSAKARAQNPKPACSSFAEWSTFYGEPNPPKFGGVLTTFEKNAKIYGGTNHHRAFKTQATVMKKGFLTR
ncbi:unnamed protein product [Ascophyllum nodosum]